MVRLASFEGGPLDGYRQALSTLSSALVFPTGVDGEEAAYRLVVASNDACRYAYLAPARVPA